jgi:hypothetical protein
LANIAANSPAPGKHPITLRSDNKAVRMKFAQAALKDMVDFLFQEDSMSFLEQRGVDSGRVAIFDATNSTRERRRWIVDQLSALPLKLLFIESICTDEAVVEKNIRMAKISNCDYNGIMTPEQAFEDFMQRVRNYEKEYQAMGVDPEENDLSFIKLIDCGRRVESNRVHGYLLGRIAQFLSNMHATTCSIYLSRHGQSEYNALQKVGGDSVLTQMGENYALKLADFADQVVSRDPKTGRTASHKAVDFIVAAHHSHRRDTFDTRRSRRAQTAFGFKWHLECCVIWTKFTPACAMV